MFIETPRFPDDIAFWAQGGPGYNTSVVEVFSGNESRNGNWSQGRCGYEISQGLRTPSQVAAAISFFRIAKGKLNGFRFKDYQDYAVAAAEGLLGTGLGTGLPTYQMGKKYTSGAFTETRTILKPISGTCTFKRDAATLVAGSGAGQIGIDYTTGIVTFVADASSGASSVTVGATTQVVLTANPGTLTAGQKLYLTGFSGADAALLNGLAHTINSVTGAGPYTFTLATNTSGKTITLGSGTGKKYPQATEALTWSGEFDVPVRFDIDKMTGGMSEGGLYEWNSIPLIELRSPT